MDLKNQILLALGLNKEEVNLAWQSKLEDGTIVVSTADTLAESVDVSVLTEDGTTIPLPIGTYKTEDGVTFVVAEEGIVDSVSESAEEVVEAMDEKDCPNGYDDDGNCKEEEKEEKTEAADVEDWEGMEKRIQNLEDAVADLKESKEGGDDESEEMAAEPTTNPKSIKTTEVKEFSIEELKEENEKLKAELAESPAEAPINTNKFSSERATPTKQDFKRMTKQEKFLYELYK